MAKGKSTKVRMADNGALEASVGSAEPPKDELSGPERKKLFVAYDKKTKEVERARKELEKLLGERSTIVEEIATSCGRGPFNYEGQILSAVSRTNKENGQQTWFFKSPGKNEIIEV